MRPTRSFPPNAILTLSIRQAMTTVARGPWEGLTIAAGRYQQLTTLGEGGMGYVYRALDRNLQTPVVIKSPRRELIDRPDQIGRFQREVGAMVQLSFPHIVPIIDVGRHDDVPFAVMRYLPGGSLEDRVPRDPGGRRLPMGLESLPTWLPSIAKALDFVHRKGYLHRDVKPSNILFDQHQEAYLSDFGVIKVFGETAAQASTRLTGQGFIAGTIDYMAPELLNGQPHDGRADQYALAITIYELLAGKAPFAGNTLAAVMVQQINEVAPPLAQSAAHVPADVSEAVARALSKDPRQRFATCVEFSEAVLRGAPLRETSNRGTSATLIVPIVVEETIADHPKTQIIAAPVVSGSTRSAPGRSKRSQPGWLAWLAVGAISGLVTFAGGVLWRLSESTDAGSGSAITAEDAALPPDPLAKLISQWSERADHLERALVIDSRPVLADPQYANAAELVKRLDEQSAQPIEIARRDLESLARDLGSMAQLHKRRSEQVEARLKHQGQDPTAREQLDVDQRELRDQGSQLLALDRRLQTLHRSSTSSSYDAAATDELTTLRDMEAIAAADNRPKISEKTAARAAELVDAKNLALGWTAIQVVARSGSADAVKTVVERLPDFKPDEQAALCWSLLLSAQPGAVDAAAKQLRSQPELLARMKRPALVDLVGQDPAAYRALIPPLVGTCTTSDERLRLFRVQAQAWDDGWTSEVEEACGSGLLAEHVDVVLVEILNQHRQGAYGLVLRLLAQHPEASLAGLAADDIPKWTSENPPLAARLIEQLLVRGSDPLRAAALAAYDSGRVPTNEDDLKRRLESDRPTNPTGLLNQLLPAKSAKALALAEFVLARVPGLEAPQVNFASASEEMLARTPVRDALLEFAWRDEKGGRAWAFQQLLGADFVRELRNADAKRASQIEIVNEIVKTLDGKLVTFKTGAGATGDRGLQIATRDISGLPQQRDPGPWAPEAAASAALMKLQAQLTTVRQSAHERYAPLLERLDGYLAQLRQLTEITFDVVQVYDLTVTKQMAGLRREMKINRIDSWDFRFSKSNLDLFQRDRERYRDLVKSLAASRDRLPILENK
jgi:serine/threonine protein kinase